MIITASGSRKDRSVQQQAYTRIQHGLPIVYIMTYVFFILLSLLFLISTTIACCSTYIGTPIYNIMLYYTKVKLHACIILYRTAAALRVNNILLNNNGQLKQL